MLRSCSTSPMVCHCSFYRARMATFVQRHYRCSLERSLRPLKTRLQKVCNLGPPSLLAAGRDLSPEPEGEGEHLASEFSRFVSDSGINEPMRYRRPTPMIAPNLAVQSIMTALQMNDYPEEDAGARTAYLFSKPYDCEHLIAGQGAPDRVRSWTAHENWLKPPDFTAMLHEKPFSVLLNCHEWKVASGVVFPSQRMGNKAIQAIQVRSNIDRSQPYTFTFCLERIEVGPYRGCWLIVGLREGDYATVL